MSLIGAIAYGTGAFVRFADRACFTSRPKASIAYRGAAVRKLALSRAVPQVFPGYAGEINSAVEFAKCAPQRRTAILSALTALMETYTRNLERADERLAEAAKAVATEQARIADERNFLGQVAATYMEFSHVHIASALAVASAGEAFGRDGETRLDAEHEHATAEGGDALKPEDS